MHLGVKEEQPNRRLTVFRAIVVFASSSSETIEGIASVCCSNRRGQFVCQGEDATLKRRAGVTVVKFGVSKCLAFRDWVCVCVMRD